MATVTRSTSKNGRSKIVSPFLLTTSRSLFFPTNTPKTLHKHLAHNSTHHSRGLYVRRIVPDASDTQCPLQEIWGV